MGENVVEEKTGGEANEPVGDEHEEEGDFRVLIAAQDPLNGSGDVIEELPSGAVDKKEAAKRNDGRIRAVERNDLLPEKECRGDGDGCAALKRAMPLSVSGCFIASMRTWKGTVAMSAPARAHWVMCCGFLMEAAMIFVSMP